MFLRKCDDSTQRESVVLCEEAIRALQEQRPPANWPLSDQMWNLALRGAVDDVITELQKPGMDEIHTDNYSILLRRFAAHVDFATWRKLQAFVKERGVSIGDVEFFNGRIEYSEQPEEALRNMEGLGIARNLGTYDALIYVAGVRGNLQDCQKLLEEVAEKKLVPTELTFCAILDYWRSKGRFENTMHLWNDMRRLQITPSPVAHEKVKEVIFFYAAKLDKDELQEVYPYVDVKDIPEYLAELSDPVMPQTKTASLRQASSNKFEIAFKPIRESIHAEFQTDATSSDSGAFADFTKQEEHIDLTGLDLQSLPPKKETPELEFVLHSITREGVAKYQAGLKLLRDNRKDTTAFLNEAMLIYQDYNKHWFNQVLLDAAYDEIKFTREGYSALVHRAWKHGDRAELERLLVQMARKSITETEEVTRIRESVPDLNLQVPNDSITSALLPILR